MNENTFWKDALRRFCQNKSALLGSILLLIIILLAIFGPLFTSHTYFETHLELKNTPPCKKFLFGTDELGRDIFTRCFFGARISLLVGLSAAFIDLFIGVIYGTVAAYFQGLVDEIMMRFCDILYSLPYLLIVILLMVIMGGGFFTIIIAISVTGWINMARIVRTSSKQILEYDFIKAALSLGASKKRIIFRHIIPNAFGTIIATATLSIPVAIFTETFLSFLGLGVSAPIASWGVMVNDALGAMRYYPWRLFFPAFFITLTMLGFNLFGDGLRDVLDPRIKNEKNS